MNPGGPDPARTHSPRPDATPDDPLTSVLAIMRLQRALDRVDAGLSPRQYRILKLAGAGGERSARLAERLAVARPTLTAIADSLVAAGLARREAEPGDRRVVRLHLTPAGHAAVAAADDAYRQWLRSVLGLTGDPDRALGGLHLLGDAAEELRRARLAGRPAAAPASPAPASPAVPAAPAVPAVPAGRA